MTPSQRPDKDQLFTSFCSRYKPQYYYWEFMIFIRRISIAMFSVSVTDDDYQIVFLIIIAIFLYIQSQCEPFIIESGNKIEIILLSCIIIVVALDISI